MDLLSPERLEAEPRQMLTLSCRLTNLTQNPVPVEIDAEIPAGWQFLGTPGVEELAAGEATTAFATIVVPGDAPAGDYRVVLKAYPAGQASEAVAATVEVTVVAFARLMVRPGRLQQPTVIAGDSYSVSFLVTNFGNAPSRIALDLESRQEWKITVQPGELQLEPGGTAEVAVTVETPEDVFDAVTHRMTLTARALDVAAGEVEAKASSSTRIVPRRRKSESMYATLDGSAQLLADWRDDEDFSSQFQLELEVELGTNRRGSISFVNPLTTGGIGGAFSQQQRIALEYEDEGMGYVRLGDVSFDLDAPLISRGLPGRGVNLAVRKQGTEIRAFVSKTRSSYVPVRAEGLQVSHVWKDIALFRATALRRSELSVPATLARPTESATLYSLYAEYEPIKGARIEAEIADSQGDSAGASGAGADSAYRLTGRFRDRRFSIDGEMVRAETYFPGAWQDVELQRLSVSWNPVCDFRAWSYLSRSRRNLLDDPAESAPEDRNLTVGASWNLGKLARLRISRRQSHREDLNLDEFDERETTTEYQLSTGWGKYKGTVSWQDQRKDDDLLGTSEDIRRLRVSGTASLSRKANVRIDYTNESLQEHPTDVSSNRSQLDLSTDLQLREDIGLLLGIQRTSDDLHGASTWFNGELRWAMPSERDLTFRFQRRSGAFGGETAVALEFSIPLSVPLSMLPRSGRMQGRLFMARDPAKALAAVKVSVDDMEVVTDKNGGFTFPALSAGEHQFTLSRTSLGLGMIADMPLPLTFLVEPGTTVEIEVPVIQSVAIAGQVVREIPVIGQRKPDVAPFADVLIELTAEGTTLYRVTDTSGRFIFGDLRPAQWTVSVWSERLPSFHEVSPLEYELDLTGGESCTDLKFVVRPVQREIEVTTDLTLTD